MDERLKLYALTKNYAARAYMVMGDQMDDMKVSRDIGYLADLVMVMKDAEQQLEILRKKIKFNRQICERLACVTYMELHKTDKIVGHFSIGDPNVKHAYPMPKANENPEQYREFMLSLGATEEMIEQRVVTPHWPRMMDWLSAKAALGEPMPPGVSGKPSFPIFELKCRLKKGVDDLDQLLTDEPNEESENGDGDEEGRGKEGGLTDDLPF